MNPMYDPVIQCMMSMTTTSKDILMVGILVVVFLVVMVAIFIVVLVVA